MKTKKFKDEAERLNVSQEAVQATFERALKTGKLYGIIDNKNAEIIRFELDEINALINKLDLGRISMKSLAADLNLEPSQVRLLLDYLMDEKKVNGVFAYDDTFLSDKNFNATVIETVEKIGSLDTGEISKKVFVSEKKINEILENCYDKILAAVEPYQQIRIEDLGTEVGLSKNALLYMLKRLILEKRISGNLDMVNSVLRLEGTTTTAETTRYVESGVVMTGVSTRKYIAYFFLFFGFSSLFGGAWTYLTSVGTIIQDISARTATPYVILGIILMVFGFFILPGNSSGEPETSNK